MSGEILNTLSDQYFEEDILKKVIQTATEQDNWDLNEVSYF